MRTYQKVWKAALGGMLSASLFAASSAAFAEEAESGTEEVVSEAVSEETDSEEASGSEAVEGGEVGYPLTIECTDGSSITIESEPERIVSMGPNMTEILYAIGAGDKLVGRTDYCDYPAEVSEVESVGTISDADIEKVLSLEPDLVVASTHFSDESAAQLEDAGVPVLYLYDEADMDGVYSMIEAVGEAVNHADEAAEVVEEMKTKLAYVEDRLANADENPTVYYVVGYGEYGDYTAGGDTFINGILTAAGADNIAADVEGWSYSSETLLEKDPDCIITSEYNAEGFSQTDPYTELTAVKEGNVFTLDTNMLDRQGPRNADAIVTIAQILHPEAFPAQTEYPVDVTGTDGTTVTIIEWPEIFYVGDQGILDILVELGVTDDSELTEATPEEIAEEAPAVVLVKEAYTDEEAAVIEASGAVIVYVDPEADGVIELLGQIFDYNEVADELVYLNEALAE